MVLKLFVLFSPCFVLLGCLQVETEKRITNPFWKILPAPKYNECLTICNEFVEKIITAARADKNLAERNDLLAHFMTSSVSFPPFFSSVLS